MSHAVPLPLRQALYRRWRQGQDVRTSAAALDLHPRTVRRLLRRLQQHGPEALPLGYARRGSRSPAAPVQPAALQLRRQHPTWGAPLIRVFLRSQGVGQNWAEPPPCASAAELQQRLEQFDQLQRAEYPSGAGGRRLAAYPELRHSGRPYSLAWEQRHWSWRRVREYLAGFAVPRRLGSKGMVSVYDRDRYVGERLAGRVLYVQFDPQTQEWVGSDEADRQLRRWPAPEICCQRIVSLRVSKRP